MNTVQHPFHLEEHGGACFPAVLLMCLVARKLLANWHVDDAPMNFPFLLTLKYRAQFCLLFLYLSPWIA